MARATRTGGREATSAVIPGEFGLSIGEPNINPAPGFAWYPLGDLARLESGHTPSRRTPEYWDGEIPWIGIRDATANHGRVIDDTAQHVTQLGIDNSSARVLPAGTVCLSRTASVGYVVAMGRPMATSQDFVNWVCGPELDARYLRYLFVSEQQSIRRFAYGSVHPTLYYPDAKALHVCIPELAEQRAIADVLGALDDKIEANRKLAATADDLAVALVSPYGPRVPLHEVAEQAKASLNPQRVDSEVVAHYSLPAFDEGNGPELVAAATIKSNKYHLRKPSVLVSKLNPRFPRVWNVPEVGESLALASTEFVVLEPTDCSTHVLWAMTRNPRFTSSLQSLVAGTSGSHQRVRPAEILETLVPDPQEVPMDVGARVDATLGRSLAASNESQSLATLRNTLLPKLMSGQLRVREAEELVADAV